jgi:hypothetical protein
MACHHQQQQQQQQQPEHLRAPGTLYASRALQQQQQQQQQSLLLLCHPGLHQGQQKVGWVPLTVAAERYLQSWEAWRRALQFPSSSSSSKQHGLLAVTLCCGAEGAPLLTQQRVEKPGGLAEGQ